MRKIIASPTAADIASEFVTSSGNAFTCSPGACSDDPAVSSIAFGKFAANSLFGASNPNNPRYSRKCHFPAGSESGP